MIMEMIAKYIIGGIVAWIAYFVIAAGYGLYRRMDLVQIQRFGEKTKSLGRCSLGQAIARIVIWPWGMPYVLGHILDEIDELTKGNRSS